MTSTGFTGWDTLTDWNYSSVSKKLIDGDMDPDCDGNNGVGLKSAIMVEFEHGVVADPDRRQLRRRSGDLRRSWTGSRRGNDWRGSGHGAAPPRYSAQVGSRFSRKALIPSWASTDCEFEAITPFVRS